MASIFSGAGLFQNQRGFQPEVQTAAQTDARFHSPFAALEQHRREWLAHGPFLSSLSMPLFNPLVWLLRLLRFGPSLFERGQDLVFPPLSSVRPERKIEPPRQEPPAARPPALDWRSLQPQPAAPPQASPLEPRTVLAPPKDSAVSLSCRTLRPEKIWRNSCGQYAVATVLNSLGIETDYDSLCLAMNPNGEPTRATPLVEYMDKKIGAQSYNNGAVEQIKQQIDSGKPAILCLRKDEGDAHWVVVSGYRQDSSGNITSWEIRDTHWGANTQAGKAELAHADLIDRWTSPFGHTLPSADCAKYSRYWIQTGTKTSTALSGAAII